MKEIVIIILLPLLAGLLLFFIPEKLRNIKGVFSVLVSLAAGYLTIAVYNSAFAPGTPDVLSQRTAFSVLGIDLLGDLLRYTIFNPDRLARLIILFISLFSVLILVYSTVYNKVVNVKNYYSWVLITAGCSYGAVLSDNLLLFLTFWGILGITLYKLIPGNSEGSSAAAKKTLILIGASDTIMVIGIGLIWRLTGSLSISGTSLNTANALTVTAFIALIVGAFTKAGAFPFHSWVPDYTKDSPATSSALLPASLDKLLGIYFLARITSGMFIMNKWLTFILLLTGGITIISAVMMALVQHNYKKLLGYHAVSQVGYMILGFGLGTPLGIAAGLFHMVNNALYKSGLFLSAGSIGYRTGKEDIDELGGLSRAMPVTFASSLIFAMAISGVPPLNGFASKWMIYQGIIDFGGGTSLASRLWILWLGAAVVGSALTLASFIKLIGGIFLGRRRTEFEKIREVPVLMWLPAALLALICIAFGVLATNVVVPRLFMPLTGNFAFSGFWNSSLVSLLVLGSIFLGVLVYFLTGIKKFRSEDSFIGGETIQDETGYPTPEFYKTIGEMKFFSWIYRKAEQKWFDIYDLSKQFILWLSHQISEAHAGILPGYIIWVFAGLIVMLLIMI
jgi:formate hydrogenlyase subunit 3/multisubunit Na+/H+ antiporter MnhD subunit